MGLGIAFMILALCFMFMAGVFYEAEMKVGPIVLWMLASLGASAVALSFAGGVF